MPAGVRKRVIGVARFSNPAYEAELREWGIETVAAIYWRPAPLDKLPDAANVIFMAARKFGSTGAESLTWAMNTFLPGLVAQRYRNSRIVAFSTGNVYPLTPVLHGGPTEDGGYRTRRRICRIVPGARAHVPTFSAQYNTPVALCG